jgi:hypothetical protein
VNPVLWPGFAYHLVVVPTTLQLQAFVVVGPSMGGEQAVGVVGGRQWWCADRHGLLSATRPDTGATARDGQGRVRLYPNAGGSALNSGRNCTQRAPEQVRTDLSRDAAMSVQPLVFLGCLPIMLVCASTHGQTD